MPFNITVQATLFPRKLASHFLFDFFSIHFQSGSGTRMRSGSATAKSSGSTILNVTQTGAIGKNLPSMLATGAADRILSSRMEEISPEEALAPH
jgi:hypothetical protein